MSDKTTYFTVVFKGNLKEFEGNPLQAKTVFGTPVACGLGDAFDEIDRLQEELESTPPAPGRE